MPFRYPDAVLILGLMTVTASLLWLPSTAEAQQVTHEASATIDFNSDYASLEARYSQRGSFDRLYWTFDAEHLGYEKTSLSSWTATAVVGTKLLSSPDHQVNLEARLTQSDHYRTGLEYAAASARLSYNRRLNDSLSVNAALSHENDWTTATGQDHQSLSFDMGASAQLGNLNLSASVTYSDVEFETPLQETHALYSVAATIPIGDQSTASLAFSDGTVVSTFRTGDIHVRSRNEHRSVSLQLSHSISNDWSIVGYFSVDENEAPGFKVENRSGGLRMKIQF